MKTTWIAAVLASSISIAFPASSPETSANASDGSAIVVASNGHSSVGAGHSIGASRSVPTGAAFAPRPGAVSSQPGAGRPMPSAGYGRPDLSRGALGQRPATIHRGQIQPPAAPNARQGQSGIRPRPADVKPRSVPARPEAHRPSPGAGGIQPRISRPTTSLRHSPRGKQNILETHDGRTYEGNWSRNDPRNRSRFDRQTQDRIRHWQGHQPTLAEACHHHNDHHRHHHDRDWWRHHCAAIVVVDWGYWGWYDGWWYPAWGYDSVYSYYEYDGPIYGYDGLLPDEVIAEVQSALQELGYYAYEVDGVFGPVTQEALARFQGDHGLEVTAAIDQPSLRALGLL